MRLRHIEVFYAVYRTGSVTGAAQELNVSQPSVSKVLRHAEDQLGYPLFRRNKGRLEPTEAAHELFGEVDEVYRQVRSLRQTAKNIGARRGGHIRLGLLPSLGFGVIPEAIARLRDEHPDVSFELDTLHSRDIASSLHERELDLAIGYGSAAKSRLAVRQVGEIELLVAARKADFVPAGGVVDFEDLDGRDFIGLRDSGPSGAVLLDEIDRLGITPREVVTARTYYVALALVQRGVGLTVVDEFTARSMPGADVGFYPFRKPVVSPVSAYFLRDNPAAELLTGFLDTVEETLGAKPDPRA
ncbi:LysR family transcriptional regulator [Pelagerythrobacter marinus]|uniref:LysR family transcriptional regulator n=1 Tax=Pelagerythrobacter marinus TaxID=538382 RepID=A0ABW9UY76_9SPHN|nr:LysR family transcriptional regulator [Pelagerythrobacter marinus]MXO68570.1 LysR family transcriptional regulator [Pelagerythrobacter marinus]USA40102.1 LysR family transcriptional regulator [Pelagerythrobacter marinus]WPZ05776.1 LysR family transcriptional regulator [Pelagerythrobacter marinus]